MRSIQAIVSGKVQGVFFRLSTQRKAISLTISGTARNCTDCSVEVQATGSDDDINQLITWLHKGPIAARVDKVIITDIELTQFDGFIIKQS